MPIPWELRWLPIEWEALHEPQRCRKNGQGTEEYGRENCSKYGKYSKNYSRRNNQTREERLGEVKEKKS